VAAGPAAGEHKFMTYMYCDYQLVIFASMEYGFESERESGMVTKARGLLQVFSFDACILARFG
jgi:hypothetical protein